MNREELQALIEAVEAESSNMGSYYHGPRHWRCVSLVGIHLARQTPGADPLVAFLFGLFHDSMRMHDGEDIGHGSRGADLARRLSERGLVPIAEKRWEQLLLACEMHTAARPTTDPVLGVCYDGDRLNLWRVGTAPKAQYISTEAGQKIVENAATSGLHDTPFTWDYVLDALFADEAVAVVFPQRSLTW